MRLLLFLLSLSTANAITLAWDPNPEPDVIGYRLHYGKQSGNYTVSINVGDVTRYEIPFEDFDSQQVYWSVVTAYNAAGLESFPSNEISWFIGLIPEDTGWGVVTKWWNPNTGQEEMHMCLTADMFAAEGIDTTMWDQKEDGSRDYIPIIFLEYSYDLVNWEVLDSGDWSANGSVAMEERRMFYRGRIEVVAVGEE